MVLPPINRNENSLLIAMQSKAAVFNNCGTEYFRSGEFEKAWGLFKGALEVVLELERALLRNKLRCSSDHKDNSRSEASEQQNSVDESLADAIKSNSYIQRAESLLSSSSSLGLTPNETGMDVSSSFADFPTESDDTVDENPLEVVRIHQSAFKLCDNSGSIDEIKLRSARIIFNLALVEHVVDPYSQNVVGLYELSSNLMSKEYISDLVQVAVINNIAVWFYENDNMDAAQACMEYILKEVNAVSNGPAEVSSPNSIRELPDRSATFLDIPKKLLSLVKSNIKFILTPIHTVSAAA